MNKQFIQLTSNLHLKHVTKEDHTILFDLMHHIYPPAYKHYWQDGGRWYVQSQFGPENFFKEISERNQEYYFVYFLNEVIGILRLLHNETLPKLHEPRAMKLHRIYLHQKVQGKGIGSILLNEVIKKAQSEKYDVLWLEVMEKQPAALNFYKKLGFEKVDSYSYKKDLLFKEYRSMYALAKKIT